MLVRYISLAAKDVNEILRRQLEAEAGKLAETQERARELEQLTIDHLNKHIDLAAAQEGIQAQNIILSDKLALANKREVEQLSAFLKAEIDWQKRHSEVGNALEQAEKHCTELVHAKEDLETR